MNNQVAFTEIESHAFAAEVNLGSTFNSFLSIAQEKDSVQHLLKQLRKKEFGPKLLQRIIELCGRETDPRYENPWDSAITIYLWLLNSKNPDLAKIGAEAILKIPRCWWSTKFSQQILFESEFKNKAERCQIPAIFYGIGTPSSIMITPHLSGYSIYNAGVLSLVDFGKAMILNQEDVCWAAAKDFTFKSISIPSGQATSGYNIVPERNRSKDNLKAA